MWSLARGGMIDPNFSRFWPMEVCFAQWEGAGIPHDYGGYFEDTTGSFTDTSWVRSQKGWAIQTNGEINDGVVFEKNPPSIASGEPFTMFAAFDGSRTNTSAFRAFFGAREDTNNAQLGFGADGDQIGCQLGSTTLTLTIPTADQSDSAYHTLSFSGHGGGTTYGYWDGLQLGSGSVGVASFSSLNKCGLWSYYDFSPGRLEDAFTGRGIVLYIIREFFPADAHLQLHQYPFGPITSIMHWPALFVQAAAPAGGKSILRQMMQMG